MRLERAVELSAALFYSAPTTIGMAALKRSRSGIGRYPAKEIALVIHRPTVALWAVNFATPVSSLDAWLALVEERIAFAAREGADVLVMPEYACAQWVSFRPPGLPPDREVPWMGEIALEALPRLSSLVRKTGVGLLAGTMPCARGGGWTNRAHLLLPDAGDVLCAVQDKLCLTPFERDEAGWMLVAGDEFRVVEWRGLRIGILICLDVELPALSARLAALALDLILVPSMTEREAGYWRVFGCAKARAIEQQAIICAVGAVGTLRLPDRIETNVSGAAVYLPCEESLGHNGVAASIGPDAESVDALGSVLVARDLPVDIVAALRAGGAEVWPGCYPANDLTIVSTDALANPPIKRLAKQAFVASPVRR
jgi:predicted amidohydrolase